MQPPEPRVTRPRLADLDEAATHSVYSVATVKRAVAGEIVLRETDETRSLFAVTSGAIELTTTAGGPITSLGVVRTGELLGTFGGVEPVPLAYTATALESSTLIEMADPAKLGARLLASWELPEAVHEVIAHQNDPEFSPPDRVSCAYPNEVGVLYLAHLCYDVLVGRSDAPPPTPISVSTCPR